MNREQTGPSWTLIAAALLWLLAGLGSFVSRAEEKRAHPPPFSQFTATDIPADERFVWQPRELVAVLGTHRGRHWGPVSSLSFNPGGKVLASASAEDGVVSLWDVATLRRCAELSPWDVSRPLRTRIWADRATFSPCGRHLAILSKQRRVHLYDPRGGRLREDVCLESDREAEYLAFSPDGATLAVAERDGNGSSLVLWDLRKARPRRQHTLTFSPQEPPLVSFAFHKEGKMLAGLSRGVGPKPDDRLVIRFWELTPDPREKRKVVVDTSDDAIRSHALSPDLDTLALGCGLNGGGWVRLWDLSGKEARDVARFTIADWVTCIAFAPDGKTLLTAGGGFFESNPVQLWDLGKAPSQGQALGKRGRVKVAAFSADGRRLALAAGEEVEVLEVASGRPVTPPAPQALPGFPFQIAFSPTEDLLALELLPARPPGRRAAIQLWSFKGTQPVEAGRVEGIDFTFLPDGALLAWRKDEEMKTYHLTTWDLARGKPRLAGSSEHGLSEVQYVARSPDGRTLAAIGFSREAGQNGAHLWDLTGKRPRHAGVFLAKDLKEDLNQPSVVAAALHGRTLALGSLNSRGEGAIRLWRLEGDQPSLLDQVSLPQGRVWHLDFAPGGRALVAGFSDAEGWKVVLYDWDEKRVRPRITLSRKEQPPYARGHELLALAVSPDGGRLATADEVGVIIWDKKGQERQHWDLPGPVVGVAFSRDRQHLATANSNGTVYVLRLSR
jgi:WD40 repeat protein